MSTLSFLKENMIEPPLKNRPVQIIHHYIPQSEEAINRYLDTAVANKMGGFCINMDIRRTKNPEETDEAFFERNLNSYLSEDTPEAQSFWENLVRFVDGCFERGLKLWFYDERAFPSGAAGQHVLKTVPNSCVKGLICASNTSKGGRSFVAKDRGKLQYAAAYPVVNDILITSECILPDSEDDENIYFNLPEDGRDYRMCAVYVRPVEFFTVNRVHYVDLMRADVTDEFIKQTHEKYLKYLGEERMRKVVAFFTDEPGLPVHGCASVFKEKNAVCAWTEEMDGIVPYERYPDIFFDTDRDFAETRRTWWNKAADLYARNYFGRIAAWCDKYGTRMTGHLYGEETLSMQIGLNADLFGLFRYMQMPGVDRLYCFDPRDVTAEKTASSAAHLYGREMTMSENSFHLENVFWNQKDDTTPENRLNSDYYQKQLGITNPASYFPYINDKAMPDRQEYELKSGRTSLFTATGTHKTDVLVLIPMNAAYSRFAVPDHKYWLIGPCTVAPYQPQPMQNLEKAYGDVLYNLEEGHYDFDLIDEKGLSECAVSDGKIFTKYESFKSLVIFDSNFFTEETKKKITDFVKCGGKVTYIVTDIPTDFVAELAKEYPLSVVPSSYEDICVNIIGAEKLLDYKSDDDTGIRIKRTETDDCSLWFIHNRSGEARKIILPEGRYTLFSTEGTFSEIGAEEITVPAKDAVMLVKEK